MARKAEVESATSSPAQPEVWCGLTMTWTTSCRWSRVKTLMAPIGLESASKGAQMYRVLGVNFGG